MKLIATTMAAALLAAPAIAGTVKVTITNNNGPEGLFYTPFLTVIHDGSYVPFVNGDAASPGIEELAEVGGTGTAAAEAVDAADPNRIIRTITDPAGVGDPGVGGPPVFDPGNAVSEVFRIGADAQYITLLSMIIPSNDTFLAATFDLFDDLGELNVGSFTLDRLNVYDAGTEVNQSFGQAFNPSDGNGPGTLGDPENGLIHLSSDDELATLFGETVPPFAGGFLTNRSDVDFSNLASVTISEVPLPAAGWALLAALGGMGAFARRRRTAA